MTMKLAGRKKLKCNAHVPRRACTVAGVLLAVEVTSQVRGKTGGTPSCRVDPFHALLALKLGPRVPVRSENSKGRYDRS